MISIFNILNKKQHQKIYNQQQQQQIITQLQQTDITTSVIPLIFFKLGIL